MANTKKVTISISSKFYSQLELQAAALDLSVNSLLKSSALATFNKANLNFLMPEDRLLIQQFQKNQIVLANILKQTQNNISSGESLPVEKIIKNFRIYQDQFVDMMEKIGQNNDTN